MNDYEVLDYIEMREQQERIRELQIQAMSMYVESMSRHVERLINNGFYMAATLEMIPSWMLSEPEGPVKKKLVKHKVV